MWAEIVYGDKQGDIPEIPIDSAQYREEPDTSTDIPDFYKAEPAVLEAELIVQGRGSRPIPDDRVIR